MNNNYRKKYTQKNSISKLTLKTVTLEAGTMPYTSRVIYSAQYHRQHCPLHVFEQFGALHMYDHDDKYLG